MVKFPHSSIQHYALSSWIEKTMSKTIHCQWENRFVLQGYGAVRKFYQIHFLFNDYQGSRHKSNLNILEVNFNLNNAPFHITSKLFITECKKIFKSSP